MRRGPSKLWPAPAFAALVLSFTPQAAAQVAPEPPPGISPLRIEPDRNGVNITTGKIDIDVPVLSVPAAPRLRFDLLQKAAPYVNGTIAIADPDSPRKDAYTVQTYGGFSESFKCTDGDCKSTARTGSFFLVSVGPPGTGISAIYQRAPTAELYTYDLVNSDASAGTTRTVQSYASRIDYPDGEAITFTYNKHLFNGVTYFRAALNMTVKQLGRPIDFGKASDRVRLGDNLNDLYRHSQICTGSRLPGGGVCGD